MNIWLDDQRNAPKGWVHLHNLEEVERLIETVRGVVKDFQIETMSFDFHLSHPKRGIDVMEYLAKQCKQNEMTRFWPKKILYHSTDVKGIEIMKNFAKNFNKKVFPRL